MRAIRILGVLGAALFATALVQAQTIDQTRGVDGRVDYASLEKYGPWDDRNYQLTFEDLRFLGDNETELLDPIPAFYRISLRKALAARGKELLVYPRSALNVFRQTYGGYLIDGKMYSGVERRGDRFEVLAEEEREIDPVTRALNGEVRVTSPNGAAESTIEINPTDPDRVIAGSNGPGGGQRMHYSSDGGETWTQAAALPLGGTCCDPTVDYSLDGTLAYAAALSSCGGPLCDVHVYRSSDNGMTWTDFNTIDGDPRREVTNSDVSDKEFIHVDRWGPSPHSDNVYLTWHDLNTMQFARSIDQGHTWTITSFTGDPSGIGSDIATDKAGNIYYIYPSFVGGTGGPGTIRLLKSTDGGASFAASTVISATEDEFDWAVPSMETRRVFQYVSADTDFSNGPFADSIYAAWSDNNGPEQGGAVNNHARIQVAYSRDAGATWTVVTPHPTADILTVDRYHQWLAVADDGSVHLVFYDTSGDGNRSTTDMFYTRSDDGAQTWSMPTRITTVTSPNITNGFEWGDYNGLSIVLNDAIAIYTDNRNEGGGAGQSVDIYAIGVPNLMPIFTDGFESGDTTAWSNTVP